MVLRGSKEKTVGGMTAKDLVKNSPAIVKSLNAMEDAVAPLAQSSVATQGPSSNAPTVSNQRAQVSFWRPAPFRARNNRGSYSFASKVKAWLAFPIDNTQ